MARLGSMCGIVGYAGSVRTACGRPLEVCLKGLERLEYRGYDSAGVALAAPGMTQVAVRKKAGRLDNLAADLKAKPMPGATVGIGHTRWATNGEPTDVNAHPHTSRDGKVALIHNGIIENASRLRLDLETEGYTFVSSTDTEVAAKLLGKIAQEIIDATGQSDIFEAIRRLARMLKGAFTILAVDSRQPDLVVGIRHDSPLVVGLGDGENYLGSDVAAFVAYPPGHGAGAGPGRLHQRGPGYGHRLSGASGGASAPLHHRLGCLCRRKGRMGFLHGQGDPRGPCGGLQHAVGPV